MNDVISLGSGHTHVVVIHGAGSGAKPMQGFARALLSRADNLRITMPDLYTSVCDDTADPIASHVQTVLGCMADQPAHLIGHSMGGFIALRVALGSANVASLTLIEPMAFGVLDPQADRDMLDEDRAIIGRMQQEEGEAGIAAFIEYWGQTRWLNLPDSARARLMACRAVLGRQGIAVSFDSTSLRDYARLAVPTVLIGGAHTRAPARRIIERLSTIAAVSSAQYVAGAGHMGVLATPEPFAVIAADHIHRSLRGMS